MTNQPIDRIFMIYLTSTMLSRRCQVIISKHVSDVSESMNIIIMVYDVKNLMVLIVVSCTELDCLICVKSHINLCFLEYFNHLCIQSVFEKSHGQLFNMLVWLTSRFSVRNICPKKQHFIFPLEITFVKRLFL